MMRLGNLTIDAPFYQAGLAGYSDRAMRMVARRHGCPFCVTEAMLDQFLVAGGKGLRAAALGDDDHPTAGQLMGSHPAEIAAGARVLVGLGYDVIDVNLACPVKKVRKKARGGHLLSVPDEAVAILDAVKQAVGDDRPCTVKLRRAYDESPGAQAAFERVLGAAIDLGYAGATVHSRTVQQKYVGPGRRAFLGELAKRYGGRGFVLGGSGDVWRPADVLELLRAGVDWVSVARGCIGNPWFFRQARALLAGDADGAARPPTIAEQRGVLLEHFELSVATHGEHRASMTMRKFGIRFARHHPEGEAVRRGFIGVRSLAEWRGVLERFYAGDGPGVAAEAALPPEARADSSCGEPVGAAG